MISSAIVRQFSIRIHRTHGAILALIVMVSLSSGCSVISGFNEDDLPHFDPNFSANLIIPGPGFPQKKIKSQISPAQQKVIDEYGPPDFIRVWWDRFGATKRLMEVHRQIDSGEYSKKPMTWLYEDEDIEIVFPDKETYRTAKIETKIKTIMVMGDPENIIVTNHNNIYRESWQYYSRGITLKFNREGNIVEEQQYQGTGVWNKP